MKTASRSFSIKSACRWLMLIAFVLSICLVDLAVLGAGMNMLGWSQWDYEALKSLLYVGVIIFILSLVGQFLFRSSSPSE